MLKKIILQSLFLLKADLFLERVKRLFEYLQEYRYKYIYGENFNFVNQGPGGFQISGDASKFEMGRCSHIKSNTFIECSGGVSIGRYFHTGRGLTIFSTSHNWKDSTKIPYDELTLIKPVVIADFVWFGANVTVLPGTVIGNGVVVAAGSVVRGSIPDFSIVAGNPAIVIGERNADEFLHLLNNKCFF
ncbi:acyltransferase [Pseudoalteromonas sp. BSi20495]|uniref:acyltransferase n=1 Tax=Pseudoalteromonas sp. BSi20495 TaxID=386429 RepID=UPI0002315D23|nr:acyltransferase [Pseudoalteromonas sp. BSi20495]GAA77703.1 chloramphenicol acetyltransferase [Pseudoalteromonas sp. BSi20495]